MSIRLTSLAAAFAIMLTSVVPALAASDAEELVTKAQLAVQSMKRDSTIGGSVSHYLKSAKGVVVVPQMIKGALGLGLEGGSGVMLARDKSGSWSYPAFYTLGAASIGLQIGGSASEVILLLMTDRGVNTIVKGNKIKLGGDIGVAAGPIGGGIEGAATLGSVDVLVYSRSKGAYIGVSLEGSILEPRESLNKQYYGAELGTKPIVIERKHSNPHAEALRRSLTVTQ